MNPQEFGKYRLRDRIAVGGTAEVFRAALVRPDGVEQTVVLKRVLPQHARDPRFRQLFREEALVVASLEHPNIVRIHDFGEMQGTCYLALEHVDGADLDTLLGPGGEELPGPPLAAYLAVQLASALEYIHGRTSPRGTPLRIVHRDISPHNILVSHRGEVKLADFGIARSALRSDKTVDGSIKGKFDYMSPEQATPGAEVDARTDLFALGAVLYQMLFGSPPFYSRNDVETLDAVRACRYRLDESWLSEPHRALVPILARCLRRAREERYPDAGALRRDLEAYLAELPHPSPDARTLAAWVTRARRAREAARPADVLVHALLGGTDPGRDDTAVVGAKEAAVAVGLVTPVPMTPTPITQIRPRTTATARPTPRPTERPADRSAERAVEPPPSRSAPSRSGPSRSTPDLVTPLPLPRAPRPPRRGTRLRSLLPLAAVALVTAGATILLTRLLGGGRPSDDDTRPSVTAPSTLSSRADASPARLSVPTQKPLAPSPPPRRADARPPSSSGAGETPTQLLVNSEPPGATVLLNGVVIGRAPLAYPAPAGAYEVEVVRSGYLPYRTTIPAGRGDQKLLAVLKRRGSTAPAAHGFLTVNSIPWAKVFVDGRPVGITPLRSLKVGAGGHRVQLRDAQGKLLRTFVAQVPAGHTKVFSFDQSDP